MTDELLEKIKRINPDLGAQRTSRPAEREVNVGRAIEKIQRTLACELKEIADEERELDAAAAALATREACQRQAACERVIREILRLDRHLTNPLSQRALQKFGPFLRAIGFTLGALVEQEKTSR